MSKYDWLWLPGQTLFLSLDKGNELDSRVTILEENPPVGPQGPAGPQGPPGQSAVATITPRGEYDATVTYGIDDSVVANGSSYLCAIANTTGIDPVTDTTGAWFLFVMQGPQGLQGPQGPAGASGTNGAQGVQGPQGLEGPQGVQGPAGIHGATGLTGAQGEKGDIGDTGPAGPQGIQGIQGPAGEVGPMGPQGNPGTDGAQGVQGVQGETGPAGPQGDPGEAGPQGEPGQSAVASITPRGDYAATATYAKDDSVIAGGSSYICAVDGTTGIDPVTDTTGAWFLFVMQGPQGIQGIQGEKGDTGDTGPAGPAGPQGIQGVAGDAGAAGVAGPAGPAGPQGIQGLKGDTGATGPAGPQGVQGTQGPKGDTGATGANGAAGVAGPQGPQGVAGAAGATGPAGPQHNMYYFSMNKPYEWACGNENPIPFDTNLGGYGTGTDVTLKDTSGHFNIKAGTYKLTVSAYVYQQNAAAGFGVLYTTPGTTFTPSMSKILMQWGTTGNFSYTGIVKFTAAQDIGFSLIGNGSTTTFGSGAPQATILIEKLA